MGYYLQVSREIVGRYERGDAVPSIDIAKRMADAFEVSLDYLVGATEKQINKEMLKRIMHIPIAGVVSALNVCRNSRLAVVTINHIH